ncbi:MAG: GMC family oxidoreductase [Thermomicrobiales bacterium]
MKTLEKVDVVTVGAGWTAAILAWKLTEAGYRVSSIEQGPSRWANPDFDHNHDSIRYSVRKAMMYPLSSETWSWRPNVQAPSLPIRKYGSFHPGQGVGGAAIHWSGQLYRFTPADFNLRSHYVEKYGEDILPEGSAIQDWPVTYEELEPYFTAFDWDIGSSGQVGNLNGEIVPGGNPFAPPFSRPYPNPPLARNIPSLMFAEASEELGYHPYPHPSGILSRAYTDPFGNVRSGCLYCGFCTRFGCEVDAKSSPQTTHIPQALKTGRYQIRPNAHVKRVVTGADGLATGVIFVDDQGSEQFQPADVVLLTGYTMTNVKLLLVSRSSDHPQGIGNSRDMVGRNLTHQIWQSPVLGTFDNRRFNLYMGNTSTQTALHDFYNDNFDHSDLDFIDGASIFSTIGEREPVTSVGSLPIGDGKSGVRSGKRRSGETGTTRSDHDRGGVHVL